MKAKDLIELKLREFTTSTITVEEILKIIL